MPNDDRFDLTASEKAILRGHGFRVQDLADIAGSRDFLYGPRRTGNIISGADTKRIERFERRIGQAEVEAEGRLELERFRGTGQAGSLGDLYSQNLLGAIERSNKDASTFKWRGNGLDVIFQSLPEDEQNALPRVDRTGRELTDTDRLVEGLEMIRKDRAAIDPESVRQLKRGIDVVLEKYEPHKLSGEEIEAARSRQTAVGQKLDDKLSHRRTAPQFAVHRADITAQQAWIKNPRAADIEGIDAGPMRVGRRKVRLD